MTVVELLLKQAGIMEEMAKDWQELADKETAWKAERYRLQMQANRLLDEAETCRKAAKERQTDDR